MRARDGFTLLEMLLTIGVTALLVLAAVQAFRNIARLQSRLTIGTEREATAQILLDRIEGELVGTMLVEIGEQDDRLDHPWLFVSEDRVFGTNDSDAIRFITQAPARATPGVGLLGLRMVSYSVLADEDQLNLYRQEEPLPDGMEKVISLENGELVTEEIAAFRLRFLDDRDEGWQEGWDSTEIAQLDRLPEAVELTVQLWEVDSAGEPTLGPIYQRVATLPIRPFGPDGRTGGAGDHGPDEPTCDDGISVYECIALFQDRIDQLENAHNRALFVSSRFDAARADPCWVPKSPSKAHQGLRTSLIDFEITADPDAECQ